MGLFDSISKSISTAVSSIQSSSVYKSLVTNNPLVQGNPLVVASKVASGQQTIGQGLQAYGKAVGIGVTAAATALMPGTLAVKATTAAGGLLTTGFVTSSPVKAVQVASKIPQSVGSLTNVGANIGTFANNPSLSTFTDIYKQNPITASALTLGGLATVGGGIGLAANTLSTIRNTSATKQNTFATAPAVSLPSDFAKQFQAIAPGTTKLDVDVSKIQRESQQDLLKSQEKVAEIQAKAALDITKEQTKQLEITQKNALNNPPAELTNTIKPTIKKKTTKKKKKAKKTKKKAKKKRKVYKPKKKKK